MRALSAAAARWLPAHPRFYLMDEPTNHVDIAGRETLEAEILEHVATCILVSHDRSFVRNIGTRFMVIDKRRLNEVEGPDAFFAQMAGGGTGRRRLAAGRRSRGRAAASPEASPIRDHRSAIFPGLSLLVATPKCREFATSELN